MDPDQVKRQSDTYDRMVGALEGLPDVLKSRPSTIRALTPLIGDSQTFIVQTSRQREQGDFIFIEIVSKDGAIRVALPPKVSEAIARQRDGLTTRSRSQASKRVAQDRMERGEPLPFRKTGSK